ncbi:hypothetical protein [Blastomonas aquatica]|uniref:Lipoprotein n=1 Tax=Blastomonas aquatica TaxID=1510276 RepID=A0ABQ1J7A4_9SPHN|nr:hypothetical protein [Blastomonas aquatica]GGB59574.1 hypothetical protein GCM10010833_13030 [Blastomonas aquatica]
MKTFSAASLSSLSLGVLAMLGGCLEPMADRPSLARRDVELRDRQAEAKAPPPPIETIADPVLARDLTGMLARADKAEADFAIARSAAQQATAAARGNAMGSENWSVAQTRISALDTPRRELSQLLGDLEVLYVARLAKEAAGEVKPGGSAQIDQTRTHVLALVASQDAVINNLKAALAS